MKTKPIPESWHQFHRFVITHSHDPAWSLTACVLEAKCSARMPRIYKALGWIKPKREPNQWNLDVPSMKMTPEMAEQIREQSKMMETASDPLGLNEPLAKPAGPMLTREDTTKSIILYTDAELVSELRRRGVDVKAQKLIDL